MSKAQNQIPQTNGSTRDASANRRSINARTDETLETSTDTSSNLLERLYRYKTMITCLLLLVTGILCLSYVANLSAHGLTLDLTRDLGIVLVTTGTVVLAADYYTRKEFLKIITEEVYRPMMHTMIALQQHVSRELGPVKENLETVSSDLEVKFKDVRECIQLGEELRTLGIEKVYKEREGKEFEQVLREARIGDEIKLLGIIISDLAHLRIQHLLMDKLREGCKLKILCLSPDSQFVARRADEEGRDQEEVQSDFSALSKVHRGLLDRYMSSVKRKEMQPGQLQLRYYDITPRYFILATPRSLVYGIYLGKARGALTTHFRLKIKEDGLSKALLEHFEWLWGIAEEIPSPAAPAPATQPVGLPADKS